MPQPPQFKASQFVSTHAPLQNVPVQPQTPSTQEYPSGHPYPHAPQLFGSRLRSVHAPLHQVFVGQTQVPPWQTGVDHGQTMPQAPQFWLSLVRSLQMPPQQKDFPS